LDEVSGMSDIELLKAKRDEILRVAARHGASNVRIFGSVARGEADDKSDVDFLVELDKDSSLMDHAALLVELETLLGRKVDVAPEDCIRPKMRDRILREAIPL
jgi:predicted nucleotidyltransferase